MTPATRPIERPLAGQAARRLAVMGYFESPACPLAGADPGLRFTNSLCAAFMWLGALLATPLVPWALAALGVLGVVTPRHPFDVLYDRTLRRWRGLPPMPPSSGVRRFSCGFASAWLVLVGLAFHLGHDTLGLALGAFQAAVATMAATTRICLPSLIYRLAFGWPERAAGRAAEG